MENSGSTFGPELLIELDRTAPEPLHLQLINGLRTAIRSGRLAPNARMPATRVLAADLGVSRRLVFDAYAHLAAEGFLLSRQGAGTVVAPIDTTSTPAPPTRPRSEQRYDVDFASGAPDLSSFPRAAWLKALRAALAVAPASTFGYTSPGGLEATRNALAGYLRRTRGVVADPDLIVLCSGASQGIGLIARLLRDRSSAPIAVENPGFWVHRLILEDNRIDTVPTEVDRDGLYVEALADGPARSVLTTPSHQSPTGVVLSAARRRALVDWARGGRLIVEDDYDSEFRFDRGPVSALHALAPDRVIYLGSASKTLAPGLRLGWMVLPAALVKEMTARKGLADGGNSVTDQLAFAHLLESGEYDRHLRQMRRRYRSRRDALLDALRRYLPEAHAPGAAAGIHLCIYLPPDRDVEEIVRRATQRRVNVESLRIWHTEGSTVRNGLIIGFANVPESRIDRGVAALADVVRGAEAGRRTRMGRFG